jgi:hypothetical protein
MTISTTTLKNAAFAIECDLWTDPATGANYLAKDGAILRRWEPVESDKDAYQLAAKLFDSIEFVTVEWPDDDSGMMRVSVDYRATRESIVLAAAEIGAALCQ